MTILPSPSMIALENLQKQSPPCCICYEQKARRDIVEYKCRRCEEGNVCSECAVKLWTANLQTACPVCNNKTNERQTWYKSYDVEMGIIRPPIFENNTSDNSDNSDSNDEDYQPCFLEKITKEKVIIMSFIITVGLFIFFIVGTMYKALDNKCSWNCKDEDTYFTIMTSIMFGFIICLAGLPIALLGLITVFGTLFELFKYMKNKCIEMFQNYITNNDLTISQVCSKITKYTVLFAFGLSCSFCVGTLFRISYNICYWDCKNQENGYIMFMSIMIGAIILAITIFCLWILGLSCACFTIGCSRLGTPNNV